MEPFKCMCCGKTPEWYYEWIFVGLLAGRSCIDCKDSYKEKVNETVQGYINQCPDWEDQILACTIKKQKVGLDA